MRIIGIVVVVFCAWWGVNISNKAEHVGTTYGYVTKKNDQVLKVTRADGEVMELIEQGFEVGDKITFEIYESRLTGRVEYRYFAAIALIQ